MQLSASSLIERRIVLWQSQQPLARLLTDSPGFQSDGWQQQRLFALQTKCHWHKMSSIEFLTLCHPFCAVQ